MHANDLNVARARYWHHLGSGALPLLLRYARIDCIDHDSSETIGGVSGLERAKKMMKKYIAIVQVLIIFMAAALQAMTPRFIDRRRKQGAESERTFIAGSGRERDNDTDFSAKVPRSSLPCRIAETSPPPEEASEAEAASGPTLADINELLEQAFNDAKIIFREYAEAKKNGAADAGEKFTVFQNVEEKVYRLYEQRAEKVVDLGIRPDMGEVRKNIFFLIKKSKGSLFLASGFEDDWKMGQSQRILKTGAQRELAVYLKAIANQGYSLADFGCSYPIN